ncbi:MAG: DUF4173 domain-containing protein [Cytophagales bacterium]|nr:DUF4173 domain-containing protein [Cytophagales bacterium]
MSQKAVVSISFSLLFSFLLYDQNVGINILIYSISFLLLLIFLFKEAFTNKVVLWISSCLLVSSIGSFIHGSDLALWGAILSFFVLIGAVNNQHSIFYGLIMSVFSSIGSIIFSILESRKSKTKKPIYILSFLIPLVFIFIFFSMYREINPLFKDLTEDFTFDNISFAWISFTFLGFILTFSIFYFRSIPFIDRLLAKQQNDIQNKDLKSLRWNESLAFIILFTAINLMLVIVNIMDINYLYLGSGLPEGITHKQFVHNGVGILVLSIFLGISILLFFLRGKLNFQSNTKIIKTLALLWITQNIFMITSTMLRNNMYIIEALLSYKRLGVYFWLLLCLIGLVVTIVKIIKNKTVWFLINTNIKIAFGVFILATLVNWDTVITKFNLKRANEMTDISPIDKHYLLSLSETNIAQLYSQVDRYGFEYDPHYSYSSYRVSNKNWLDIRLFEFMEEEMNKGFQSFSFMRQRVLGEINALQNNGKITNLDLRNSRIVSLEPIKNFSGLKKLNLSNSSFNGNKTMSSLNYFKTNSLYLDNNSIQSSLDTLQENQELRFLSLKNNRLTRLSFLDLFPNLDTLMVDGNQLMQLSSIPEKHQLKYLSINKNPLNDISDLKELTELRYLSLNEIQNSVGTLPHLPKLLFLNLNNSANTIKRIFNSNHIFNVESLQLYHTGLDTLSTLFTKDKKVQFPQLKKLDLSSNHLKYTTLFQHFTSINDLNLSHNNLKDLTGLENLSQLKRLNLSSCNLDSLNSLQFLPQLEYLDITSNHKITDFQALNSLKNLKKLKIGYTEFDSLFIIQDLEKLEYLNVTNCRIKDIKTITNFKNLKELRISYVKEKEIKYLQKLSSLKKLNVTHCEYSTQKKLKKVFKNIPITFTE